MADNTQILLVEKPQGTLTESHFESRTAPIPAPEDGQVLLRNVLLSQDAANRAWMQGPTYKAAVNPGDVMHGYAIAEVVESRSPDFAPRYSTRSIVSPFLISSTESIALVPET